MKKIACAFLFVIVVVLSLTGCNTKWMPQTGEWYCDELQIQITFTRDGECFAVLDGIKIKCCCENDRSSKWFSVLSQDPGAKDIRLGQELFCAERVSLTENEFVVKEEKTGELYVFIRIEDDSKTD